MFIKLILTTTRLIQIEEYQAKICANVKSSESKNLNKSINMKVNINKSVKTRIGCPFVIL